jgi:hypothetical protein
MDINKRLTEIDGILKTENDPLKMLLIQVELLKFLTDDPGIDTAERIKGLIDKIDKWLVEGGTRIREKLPAMLKKIGKTSP